MKHVKSKILSTGEYPPMYRKIIKLTLISVAISFASLAIVGTQIFYPFHIIIGFGIYLIALILFGRRIYLSRKYWQQHKTYTKTKKILTREKRMLFLSVLFLAGILVLISVRPLDNGVFNGISDKEIIAIVNDDLYQSITAMDYLESSAQELVESLRVQSEDPNTAKKIDEKFSEFLRAVSYSELITERNKYFANIPYSLWDTRVKSFMISYSLYVKKYELLHRVMIEASGSEYKKKIMNHFIPSFERGDIYNEMITRFYSPKTRLRITGGWWYLNLFADTNSEYGGEYEVLKVKSSEGYEYLFRNFGTTVLKSGEVVVDATRNEMFNVWFPLQRNIANTMGHIVISQRGKTHLITNELIYDMQAEMLPGDVMLQRRNWYLSNVGIPGFWTHAAVYTGAMSEMNNYFSAEFPLDGFVSFSEYVENKYPLVYVDYMSEYDDGNTKTVIEAIEPGVVIRSLETSAYADFVVTLRPKLEKKDKMLALFKVFENYHKPYDYNFDFDTRDALVCSELVYDAYFEDLPYKQGLQFEASLVNGRKMVSPLDMAKKFKNEFNTPESQFEFVYFIRTYESDNEARSADVNEFLESIDWNKFSFLQE